MPEKDFSGRANIGKFWTTDDAASIVHREGFQRGPVVIPMAVKDCGEAVAVAQALIHSCQAGCRDFSKPC